LTYLLYATLSNVLVVEIVGVEPSTASLAGDWAAHQAIARRTQVEACPAQVSVTKICPRPVDFSQASFTQVSTNEISPEHSGAGQERFAQVGVVEIGIGCNYGIRLFVR
jgi:hypothetical protein